MPASPAMIRKASGILALVPVRVIVAVVMALGMIVARGAVMRMVVDMAIERERPARPRPEERAVLWRGRYHLRRPLAADMAVEADDAVGRAHDHMEVVADHQNRDARIAPHFLD